MDPQLIAGRRGFLGAATGALGLAAAASSASAQTAGGSSPSRSVSVDEFGARGDGRTDDTAALQRAIDSVSGTGGVVSFPPGRYRVTSTLRVRSAYPITLTGEMFGQMFQAECPASAILVGARLDYLIEYSAPDQNARAEHGAGAVRGLAFVDPTSPDNASPGLRQIIAALYLKDFALGTVENCTFHWIRGSAIRTEFAVMSSVRGCRIRYCGDADRPERAAVLLSGSSLAHSTQSFVLDDTRIEVCYSTYYVDFNTSGPAHNQISDVTFRGCKFEAATVEYPESNKTFVRAGCQRFLLEGCGFNRTLATAVEVAPSGRGQIIGCSFATSPSLEPSLLIAGARCIVLGNIFEDGRRRHSVEVPGSDNQLVANTFYSSGSVHISGRGNSFKDNHVTEPTAQEVGYFLDLGGGANQAVGNKFDAGHQRTEIGGIVSRGADLVVGNLFDRWVGEYAAIRREAPAAIMTANQFLDVSAAYSGVASAATGLHGSEAAKIDMILEVLRDNGLLAADTPGASNNSL